LKTKKYPTPMYTLTWLIVTTKFLYETTRNDNELIWKKKNYYPWYSV